MVKGLLKAIRGLSDVDLRKLRAKVANELLSRSPRRPPRRRYPGGRPADAQTAHTRPKTREALGGVTKYLGGGPPGGVPPGGGPPGGGTPADVRRMSKRRTQGRKPEKRSVELQNISAEAPPAEASPAEVPPAEVPRRTSGGRPNSAPKAENQRSVRWSYKISRRRPPRRRPPRRRYPRRRYPGGRPADVQTAHPRPKTREALGGVTKYPGGGSPGGGTKSSAEVPRRRYTILGGGTQRR
jgi:hypothetical protein